MATNYVVKDPQHVQDENGDIIGYMRDKGQTLVYTPRYQTDPLTGMVTGLVGPGGGVIGIGQTTLSRFQAALAAAKAGTRNAKILMLGDSTTAGYFASGSGFAGNRQLCTGNYLAKSLSQFTGYYGNTIGDSANNSTNFLSYDPRWALGSGWTTSTVTILGGGSIGCTAIASTSTFTPEQPFDTIDIYYIQNTTYGSMNINVDGGATIGAAISCAGSLSIKKVTRTCVLGTHTVNFVKTDTNTVLLVGVSTYNSAVKGVEVLVAGTSGMTSTQAAANTNVWDASYSSATGTLATIAPDLCVINIGINDWIGSVAPATYAANLQTVIDACRLYGEVIIQTPVPELSGDISIANQRLIVSQMRQLAIQNGALILDIHSIWANYAYAQGTLGYYLPANDHIHPGAAGYAAIAASAKLLIGI